MEILNTIGTESEIGSLLSAVFLGVILFVLLGAVVTLIREREFFAVFMATIACLFVALGCAANVADYVTPDPTQYEVLITDMDTFNTDKYEIIEQRGKIFVVQETEQ